MAKSTILFPWLRGVIEITGGHDTGKTIAMLQTVKDFSKTAFVDDDVKGDGTVRQMKEQGVNFGAYYDLAKERSKLSNTPTADELLQQVVFPLFDDLTSSHYDVIIFDTWRIVYQAARTHVERNQGKYSNVVTFRGTNEIVQGLISKVARMIERQLLVRLKESCDLLLISHHLKDRYVSNVNVGLVPESSATFDEVCNMRIWLKPNPTSKVPIMLFLKRPNIARVVDGKGLLPVNMVPVKVTPTKDDERIWDAIARYEKDPIQSRAPRPDETPTPEEFAIISKTMTDEQKEYVRQMIAYNTAMEKQLAASFAADDSQSVISNAAPSPQDGLQPAKKTMPDDYPVNAVAMLTRAKNDLGISKSDIEEIIGRPFSDINKTYQAKDWEMLLQHQKGKANGAETKKASKKK